MRYPNPCVTCGHSYGQHSDGVSGPCHTLNCDCPHFKEHLDQADIDAALAGAKAILEES